MTPFRALNYVYRKSRGIWAAEYADPFTYADGGITAQTGGNWTDVGGGGWLIQSNKLATPVSVASGAAYSQDFATWNRQKAYQIEALGIQASAVGGQTRLMMETDTSGSNQITDWLDIQYLSASSVQLILGRALTSVVTVAGNNPGGFGVPWNLLIDVDAAYTPATFRRHRVYFNGSLVIDSSSTTLGIGTTGATTRRISIWSTWGNTQLWKVDRIRLSYQT